MLSIAKLRKIKKKRFLILSAGGPQSGIQCMYCAIQGDSWETLAHTTVPYPQPIEELIETLTLTPGAPITLERFSYLDHRVSYLFLEAAKTVLLQAHKSHRQPHLIVMNKCNLFKSWMGDNYQSRYWDVSLGDAQLLASSLNAPVVTDFVRHSILAGQVGELPLFPGNIKIAKNTEPVSVYLNVGIISHMTITDNQVMSTVIDSDVGPGTRLIDLAARDAGSLDGFDRDGSCGNLGKVNNNCVEELASQPWFVRPSPKQAFLQDFVGLYAHPCLAVLSPVDKVATLTALTARTAFEFYKREFRHVITPETVHVSGGGAHNLTLLEYLKTYFDPISVKSVEDSGIPAALRIPLALGLTVHEYVLGRTEPLKAGTGNKIAGVGRWVFP